MGIKLREAERFIIDKLNRELPDDLYYHGIHHTMDVYQAVVGIAEKEGVEKKDIDLLRIAALYHDSGFIKTYKDHEKEGCKLVRQFLPDFGFNNQEIEVVCGLIMATKIPQTPKNHLEKIICDADLDYLGRDDFYDIGQTLLQELRAYEFINDDKDWNPFQIKFLDAHHFFTDTSIKLREDVKRKYLQELKIQEKNKK